MSTAELTITHTAAEGTLIDGTHKGDGTAEILKANRWRWGRSIGTWYVPHSRDRLPKRAQIEATRAALEADGWTVDVEIDDELRPTEQVEADRMDRQEDRVEAMGAKAERAKAREEAAREAADRASRALPPMGEPIKVGHHSEGRHRNALDKVWKATGRAVQAADDTKAAEYAHAASKATTGARYCVVTVANRIDHLAAEVRRLDRLLAELAKHGTADTQFGQDMRARRDDTADQLTYWQKVREEQIATGEATDYGPDTISPGDLVELRGTWYRVLRANKKTVTVQTDMGNGRANYTHLTGHRPTT